MSLGLHCNLFKTLDHWWVQPVVMHHYVESNMLSTATPCLEVLSPANPLFRNQGLWAVWGGAQHCMLCARRWTLQGQSLEWVTSPAKGLSYESRASPLSLWKSVTREHPKDGWLISPPCLTGKEMTIFLITWRCVSCSLWPVLQPLEEEDSAVPFTRGHCSITHLWCFHLHLSVALGTVFLTMIYLLGFLFDTLIFSLNNNEIFAVPRASCRAPFSSSRGWHSVLSSFYKQPVHGDMKPLTLKCHSQTLFSFITHWHFY